MVSIPSKIEQFSVITYITNSMFVNVITGVARNWTVSEGGERRRLRQLLWHLRRLLQCHSQQRQTKDTICGCPHTRIIHVSAFRVEFLLAFHKCWIISNTLPLLKRRLRPHMSQKSHDPPFPVVSSAFSGPSISAPPDFMQIWICLVYVAHRPIWSN